MPTPVTVARQCLAPEAAAALDDAVAIASRRGNSQTTSLHMVAALLALPASRLREACNNACSAMVQYKTLELSLGVSLDRLPSSRAARIQQPPVANSLMAAVKRSQANQRRQPESFGNSYQQHCSSGLPLSSNLVKVEILNLVFSMLDDPLVSRVFGEAGFSSYDVKLAALKQGRKRYNSSHLYGYSARCKKAFPPLFLCNLSNIEIDDKCYRLPFTCGDENMRKIGEVMVRAKRRNPLLLGSSAGIALTAFLDALRRRVEGVLPVELNGVSVVCVEDEVNGDKEALELRLKEVETVFRDGAGQGVVVNLGDLRALAGDDVGVDGLRSLVERLGSLVRDHGGKVWLIGAVASYNICNRILNKLSSIEEEWDLAILPITCLSLSSGGLSRTSSLMESFVPLGGFFSMPFDTKGSFSNALQPVTQCHVGNKKDSQEVTALSRRGLCAPVAEHHRSHLPSLLFPSTEDTTGHDNTHYSNTSTEQGSTNLISSMPIDIRQQSPSLKELCSSNASNLSISSKAGEKLSEFIGCQCDLESHPCDASGAGINDEASPKSVTSVATDLCLSIIPSVLTDADTIRSSVSYCHFLDNNIHSKESEALCRFLVERVGHQEAAINAVVDAITQRQKSREGFTRICCGDVWINFRGPDKLSKRKFGLALAEALYGNTGCLIYVDLSFQDKATVLTPCILNKYDVNMRGTVVDYIVEKLSKGPGIVFLENIDMSDLVIQNTLSQAVKTGRLRDLHGREVNISHSTFLMTTRSLEGSENLSCSDELTKYTEEDIIKVKGGSIQICVGFELNDMKKECADLLSVNKRKVIGDDKRSDLHRSMEVTKRAHKRSNSNLDLNLPARDKDSDTNSSCENPTSWLEDFDRQIDRVVVFKPFDFDTLAEKLYNDMTECLHRIIGFKCTLEIESQVMQQLLAAAYVFDSKSVEDWIQCVLRQGFMQATAKHGLNAHSVVQLVACKGSDTDEQNEGIRLLPGRIMMN